MSGEDPLRVLFVCTANICRSPYAQLRAHQLLGPASPVQVASAGVRGFEGNPMEAEMADQLRLRGGDPTGFASRPFSGRSIRDADLILTFEAGQRQTIVDTWPHARGSVFTWGQFAGALDRIPLGVGGLDLVEWVRRAADPPQRSQDIPDPYGRGTPGAAVCAVQIDRLLERSLPRITGPSGSV